MLVYWNAGQPGFWDPEHDGGALDFATPLGFEPLIASDPAALRREALRLLTPAEPALWLAPDPGLGALSTAFATPAASAAAAAARRGRRGRRDAGEAEPFLGVSRAAVVRLRDPDWIVVCFRGTTPSPMRGLLREGQVNSMAGQERWAEAPKAMRDARVHRGYAAAYRSLLADVEGAAADWARAEALRAATKPTKPPPRVVVVGHSLGGALATLCAARLAHDDDFRISPSLSSAPVAPETTEEPRRRKRAPRASAPAVSCVTFGQPRVGDDAFRRGVDEHSPGLRYTRVVRGGAGVGGAGLAAGCCSPILSRYTTTPCSLTERAAPRMAIASWRTSASCASVSGLLRVAALERRVVAACPPAAIVAKIKPRATTPSHIPEPV